MMTLRINARLRIRRAGPGVTARVVPGLDQYGLIRDPDDGFVTQFSDAASAASFPGEGE